MKLLMSKSFLALFAVGALLLAGCAGSRYRESTGEYVDDSAITAKIKSAYAADPTVSALRVKVTTYKGIVQLSGFVNSEDERQKAVEIAQGVNGVQRVKDNLIVKPASKDTRSGSMPDNQNPSDRDLNNPPPASQ